jgi:hypothetical protein
MSSTDSTSSDENASGRSRRLLAVPGGLISLVLGWLGIGHVHGERVLPGALLSVGYFGLTTSASVAIAGAPGFLKRWSRSEISLCLWNLLAFSLLMTWLAYCDRRLMAKVESAFLLGATWPVASSPDVAPTAAPLLRCGPLQARLPWTDDGWTVSVPRGGGGAGRLQPRSLVTGCLR